MTSSNLASAGGASLRLRALTADQCGASAIEFALTLPVFLILALGIIAYGIYFGAAHSAAQLAADAARASVAGLSDTERADLARKQITTTAGNYVLLNPARIKVDAGPLDTDASQFRVAVKFDASELPIWVFGGLVPLPSPIIERTAVVKRGGY